MPKHSFAGVPTACSLANSPTFLLITSSLYHLHGRLHAVAIDKFTKWIKYKLIATLTADEWLLSSAISYTTSASPTPSSQI
jgi:hypothetical protein